MEELLPCPFCGSSEVSARAELCWYHEVSCGCGGSVHRQGAGERGRKLAIQKWNRRVDGGVENEALRLRLDAIRLGVEPYQSRTSGLWYRNLNGRVGDASDQQLKAHSALWDRGNMPFESFDALLDDGVEVLVKAGVLERGSHG